MEIITPGDRIREVRKRRGLSQKQLAQASQVSVSLVRKLEQQDAAAGDIRVETLHRIAVALRVRTSDLLPRGDADQADPGTVADWSDVRAALMGRYPEPGGEPTVGGVLATLRDVAPAVAANRYAEVRPLLPGMIRDAAALNGAGRDAAARVLNLTGWLLVMTRQWDAAQIATSLAADAAQDRLDAAAAANTACWSLLRQGRLAEAGALAGREADDIEPRFSRATVAELAIWGRMLLGVANAAVRDNRPGEAQDALALAQAAASRIGREVTSDRSTTRTFGPVSVAMIAAETAAIMREPDRVLAISRVIPSGVLHPGSASRRRHQLDVASALVMLRRYDEAVQVLARLRDGAPEWLPQQRYARDILARMTGQRRTLTPQMRMLADTVRLPL